MDLGKFLRRRCGISNGGEWRIRMVLRWFTFAHDYTSLLRLARLSNIPRSPSPVHPSSSLCRALIAISLVSQIKESHAVISRLNRARNYHRLSALISNFTTSRHLHFRMSRCVSTVCSDSTFSRDQRRVVKHPISYLTHILSIVLVGTCFPNSRTGASISNIALTNGCVQPKESCLAPGVKFANLIDTRSWSWLSLQLRSAAKLSCLTRCERSRDPAQNSQNSVQIRKPEDLSNLNRTPIISTRTSPVFAPEKLARPITRLLLAFYRRALDLISARYLSLKLESFARA